MLGTYVALGQPAPYAEAQTIGEGAASFDDLSKRFTDLAKAKGAGYAFEVLRRAPLPPGTDLHLLGHAVGYMLYDQKGVAGIADCTQDFRNACSHSIVISTLSEYGESALPLIHDACTQAPGGPGAYTMCYHGLGHGVFAYYQYSLPETVAFCKKTGTEAYRDEEYVQCVSGAIMELMGGGGHDEADWLAARKKYLTNADPLAPCDTAVVPQEAKPMCLVYLTPHLWELAGIDLGTPDPALFPKAFSFCDALPKSAEQERESCYGGFGKEFVPLAAARDIRAIAEAPDQAYALAISWCGLASDTEAREACVREAVASVFWGGENDPEGALRFCSLAPAGGVQQACYTKLGEDTARYVVADKIKAAICNSFPDAYKQLCKTPS